MPLLLSGCVMLIGCANHEEIIANTILVMPSATPNNTSAFPDYGGAVIPAHDGAGSNEIWLDDYESRPNVLIVATGTTVTWINYNNGKPLTVVSDDGLFASDIEPPAGKFSYLFEYPGAFGYTIDPYSGVWRGVVIVVK
jgi:plastocyanin